MKYLPLVLTFLVLVNCSAEPIVPLQAIQLKRALEPDSECKFSLTNESWVEGWYDPKAASSMSVHLEVGATGLVGSDFVDLQAVRVCYSDMSRATDASDDHTECDLYFRDGTESPGFFGETVNVNAQIENCSGEGCLPAALVQVQFLAEPMLQKIYSESYSSSAISVWFSDAPMGEAACCRYFYTDLFLLTGEDRVCCTNAIWEMGISTGPETGAPWGEFGSRPGSELKVEFQLVGQSSNGETVTSTWLSLPTTVCPGCTSAHGETTGCDTMTGEFCDFGVCDVDGIVESCTDAGCSEVETPCTNFSYQLDGETPDVEGCIVSQMQGITQRCKEVRACD
ncbi:MAG: hypothetical protein HOI23_00075 [Deltaproteobacteria bacterium]|jgi:hypothetical protein|nr:hypothetical protein [Deltaproteobacteria bacterium]MBT6434351.1 hypothetical protein [Deltaproteobacteria bacterium]MBT6488522.1 hypothetical protein [Deltaproteobacteria bacterium]